MPFSLFKRKLPTEEATSAYQTIVSQARLPFFYLDCGVPDTLDGRFDLIVLHAFLLMHRTAGEGEVADQFNQTVFDVMFADMEGNLRTMGVSDLRIGKKVKEMARAFYGRSVAYREALADTDDAALYDALQRNLYRLADPRDVELASMVAYTRKQADQLAVQDLASVLAGKVKFVTPEASGERPS
ncbi:MAG: ubiquinol-cytochrome C chaperone family protein [Pseudomonadota bacterium]